MNEKNKSVSREFLVEEYLNKKRSFGDIAKQFGTYANKIRREAIRFGIQPRDKSKAQKNALKSGSHTHPTKGPRRSQETKEKIGDGVAENWDNMSEEEYNRRSEIAKDKWNAMSQAERDALQKKASDAVRKASKEGSKLENYLLNVLRKQSYVVQFHRKGLLPNERLEIDLFLPNIRTAIEIDGPSHFFPIWGEDSLARNLRADAQKTGLLLSRGFVVIRVKHLSKHVSESQMRKLSKAVLEKINQISKKFPSKNKRLIEIEV